MRLKFIFAIFIYPLSVVAAQPHPGQLKAKRHPGNVSSIKRIGANISVDQMIIVNDKNLNSFLQDLQNTPINLFYKVDNIPESVRSFLESFSRDKFTIANPDANWNCCCDRDDSRPNRQLICQGSSGHLFMISYLTGGIGTVEHLVLLKLNKQQIIDFWTGEMMQGDLTNQAAIIKSLKNHKFQHWPSKDRINI
jgi:hypothetical protein